MRNRIQRLPRQAVGHTLRLAIDLRGKRGAQLRLAFEDAAHQIGRPVLLSDAEMETVLEKFKTYGQQQAAS